MDKYLDARNDRIDAWGGLSCAYVNTVKSLEKAWKNLEKEHSKLQSEKKKLVEANGGSNVNENDILDINAGGEIIRVSRGTLTQLKGSILEALFSGRWENQLARDAKGRIFLDVNPTCFKSIVDYLNERKITPPETSPDPPSVDADNQVFLDSLLIALGLDDSLRGPIDSTILTDRSYIQALSTFLEEEGFQGGLTLLYRSSRDGSSGNDFHRRCDNQGPTVSVAKSTEGYICGGFADVSWKNNGDYQASTTSRNAFLFALCSHDGSAPVKMKPKEHTKNNSIYCRSSYGPTFGGGHDLKMNSSASYVNIGHTYVLPPGTNTNFITGSSQFHIAELEVFKVDSSIPTCRSKQKQKDPLSSTHKGLKSLDFGDFPEDVKLAFKAEKEALLQAHQELNDLQVRFKEERQAIEVFGQQGGGCDIVYLNVSGRLMAVKRSTLGQLPNSVLCKQFADPLWNSKLQSKNSQAKNPPRKWNSKEVVAWVKAIQGVPNSAASKFADVTGVELLALGREDIKDLGVTRPGTVAILVEAIQKLRDEAVEGSATFIEHSEYCFGKIIDQLRLRAISAVLDDVPKPKPPEIREPDKKRFKRIVEYYFPSESDSSSFLS